MPNATSASTDKPADEEQMRTGVDNLEHTLLVLAIFVVLVAGLLYWIHRRIKRHRELLHRSGQHASARDVEGWADTHTPNDATPVRREEGLDELGEAPPPYQPKSGVTLVDSPVGSAQDRVERVAIPLRTLSRSETEGTRPPDYGDTLQAPAVP
ncbi:hypothetical protein EJ02DRAFT_206320 [Clathrospora elynae]|uniref:Uncharacterized protein n=1 Tax=Clathrospora elynae TaxID=706981 RepID=A0A6A5SRU5_9PLEO|nr:hypothetical protein EJ02DRAFT_206320 [Clathrospora elynae]